MVELDRSEQFSSAQFEKWQVEEPTTEKKRKKKKAAEEEEAEEEEVSEGSLIARERWFALRVGPLLIKARSTAMCDAVRDHT